MLTLSELQKLLSYNPETGEFCWIKNGKLAGAIDQLHGYRSVMIRGRKYYHHRLAFVFMTGAWPRRVDHLDRNKSNNRWANLRDTSASQNSYNVEKRKNNSSGYTGVFRDSIYWRAKITVEGKVLNLGHFKNFEEAKAARIAAEKEYIRAS